MAPLSSVLMIGLYGQMGILLPLVIINLQTGSTSSPASQETPFSQSMWIYFLTVGRCDNGLGSFERGPWDISHLSVNRSLSNGLNRPRFLEMSEKNTFPAPVQRVWDRREDFFSRDFNFESQLHKFLYSNFLAINSLLILVQQPEPSHR